MNRIPPAWANPIWWRNLEQRRMDLINARNRRTAR